MQKIVPAILTKDPGELQLQLELLKNNTKWVQIDIMDGRFVPETSVNISELGEAYQSFNLEIHLMVQDPQTYLDDCKGAGAKRVFFHLEGTKEPERVLSLMEKYSFQKGIAINPETPLDKVQTFAKTLDALLLLSIVPGAQGREFIPGVLRKIPLVREFSPKVLLGMDGGINKENIKQAFQAGVDYVAVGSGMWQTENPIETFTHLNEMIR